MLPARPLCFTELVLLVYISKRILFVRINPIWTILAGFVGYSVGYLNGQIKKDSAMLAKSLILLAGTTRLELATSGVTGRRSNQN